MNVCSAHPSILAAMRDHRFDLARHEQGHGAFDSVIRVAGFEIGITEKFIRNTLQEQPRIKGQAGGDAHEQSGLSGGNFIWRHFHFPYFKFFKR